jgi:hypothetical protein
VLIDIIDIILPRRDQMYKSEFIQVTDIFTQRAGMPLSISKLLDSFEKSE